jgi:hypothetical protein
MVAQKLQSVPSITHSLVLVFLSMHSLFLTVIYIVVVVYALFVQVGVPCCYASIYINE